VIAWTNESIARIRLNQSLLPLLRGPTVLDLEHLDAIQQFNPFIPVETI
jgi:hypothetical protein